MTFNVILHESIYSINTLYHTIPININMIGILLTIALYNSEIKYVTYL